jgi:hypothetical protein
MYREEPVTRLFSAARRDDHDVGDTDKRRELAG